MDEHGHVIIDELAPSELMDRIEADMEPYLEATAFCEHEGLGLRTRRTGRLIARSPAARELIMGDLYLGLLRRRLSHAKSMQLTFTEIIALSPGAEAQFPHRDEVLYDAYPFPADYEVDVNSLWALSDYTEEMGATRVVPGSDRTGRAAATFSQEDTVAAEMARGSVMIYSGKLVHGGGHNRSDRVRKALDLGFSVGWVRQEENQFLACPAEIARTLPEELLLLMGYDTTNGYGHIGRDHPLAALGRR
jgi:ectoine hydroxylase-related dioxygenase (phytanoyl-CoA dioxygenase family)